MSIKKVLLVVPNFLWCDNIENRTLWHFIPYNICLLAATIEHDWDVEIVDAYKKNMTQEEFKHTIADKEPDYVGISVLFNMYGVAAHICARLIKEVSTDIVTQVGGVYATTNAQTVMEDQNFDYLISGEGENALRGLLLYLNSGGQKMPQGVWYRENGMIVDGGHASYIENLDDFPMPAYHLIDYNSYIYNADRKSIDGPTDFPYSRIFSSRGCPFDCCFCQVNKIMGRNFRPRSAKHVLKEIEWLVKEYGVKFLIFDDDNFLVDRDRAIEILKGLIPLGIKWKALTVAAFFLDDELIELMKRSGCEYICVAIESGSERVLRTIINKPLKLEKGMEVITKLRKEGIFTAANFVIGFPGETWDEIRQTIRFAEECKADYVKIFAAMPLPGTRLFRMALESNALTGHYSAEELNWNNGVISTDEFSAKDTSILRLYEWDRINFSTEEKTKKIANMMNITMEEMQEIRRKARKNFKVPEL